MLERLFRHKANLSEASSGANALGDLTVRSYRWRACAPPLTQPFTTIIYHPPVVFPPLTAPVCLAISLLFPI